MAHNAELLHATQNIKQCKKYTKTNCYKRKIQTLRESMCGEEVFNKWFNPNEAWFLVKYQEPDLGGFKPLVVN